MTVSDAIAKAEAILPGVEAPEGEIDPRWQAIIEIGEFVETNPEEIWSFILKWGVHENEDLRMAISTCLLELLLEYHFDLIFPRLKKALATDKRLTYITKMVWAFGQSDLPANRAKLERLQKKLSYS
jgi:hypothetical protein